MVFQTAILVGGRGARLGQQTQTIPKPLVDVGGGPFLVNLIEQLQLRGCGEILLLAGYRSEQIEEFRSAFYNGDPAIRIVAEKEPLGTGGAIWNARDELEDVFVVLNGDTFFDIDPKILLAKLDDRSTVAMGLRQLSDAKRFGTVELVQERIRSFNEKSIDSRPGIINAGLFAMSKSVLREVPPAPFNLEIDLFPRLAKENCIVGEVLDAPFIDIGVPVDLERAQTLMPKWMRNLRTRIRG